MSKAVHKLTKTKSFFHRIKVGSLNILYYGYFNHFAVSEHANDNRNFVQLRHLRGAPTPLTRDDLIVASVFNRANHQRLDDPFCPD